MTEAKSDRELAAAFLASELMKETQSYLERGRRLQGLTEAQLASKWVVDFKAWQVSRVDQDDPGNSAELDDTAAELRLRSLEPPYDQVQGEIKAMVGEVERAGPGDPTVSAKIGKFLELTLAPGAAAHESATLPHGLDRPFLETHQAE
jgi:hypothetical protein